MEFHILGPLRVTADDGRPVPVIGRRQETALASLLLHAYRPVTMARLVDAMWDREPPATAKRQLQNTVSALRQQIREAGVDRPVIVSSGSGYQLRPDAGAVDALVFADRVASAQRHAADDEPALAVAELRSALELWSGPVLAGRAGVELDAAVARLDEQRLLAWEECLDAELRQGRCHQVVGESAELVAEHPLRERLVGLLMRALDAAGRRSEALDAYQRLRAHLARELGIDPGDALRELHTAILRGDGDRAAAPAGGAARAAHPPAVAAPAPAQLPAVAAGFTGRVDQLKDLDELLAEGDAATVAIAAIAGLAGVGKTTLAAYWGHRMRDHFPDGQLFVHLGGYGADGPVPPVTALHHLLRSLGEPAEQIPVDVQTAAGRYRSLLAGRRVLVVLDDAAGADQVRPLLPASPGCVVLVTSRHRLPGLVARDGARGLALDVLSPEEAHTLLVRVLGPERVAAEPEAAVELARVCSYLPLALRIAAANIANHSWSSLAGYASALRDGDRLSALELDGDLGVRRAFDLSYQMLHPDVQRVFRLTGPAPGTDITAGAVAALAGSTVEHAHQQLVRLTAAHLMGQPVPGRYTCHDLLREYAAERSRSEGSEAEHRPALRRLYDWYLRHADAAARALYPHVLRLPMPALDPAPPAVIPDQTAAIDWYDSERANLLSAIRHAAEHGPRSVAWLLADALRSYFWLRMHLVDWQSAAQAALAAAELDGDLPAQAAALLSLGDLHYRQSQYPPAVKCHQAALVAAQRAGWMECQAVVLGSLGVTHQEWGHLAPAADYLERALAMFRDSGSRYHEAITLGALSRVYWQWGRLAEAADRGEQSLAVSDEIGSRLGAASALGDLGEIRYAQGRLDEATKHLLRARQLFQGLGDRTNGANTQRGLGAVRCARGDPDGAAELLHDALAAIRELGNRQVEANTLAALGAVDQRRGRYRTAGEHCRRALDLAQAIGDPFLEATALLGLASANQCLGDHQATEQARAALAIARRAGYRLLEQRAEDLLRPGSMSHEPTGRSSHPCP